MVTEERTWTDLWINFMMEVRVGKTVRSFTLCLRIHTHAVAPSWHKLMVLSRNEKWYEQIIGQANVQMSLLNHDIEHADLHFCFTSPFTWEENEGLAQLYMFSCDAVLLLFSFYHLFSLFSFHIFFSFLFFLNGLKFNLSFDLCSG